MNRISLLRTVGKGQKGRVLEENDSNANGPQLNNAGEYRLQFPRSDARELDAFAFVVLVSPPSSMQSVAHLRKSLLSFHSSGTIDDERELFDLLVTARPALLNLFDVPPRSEAERKDLQQGAYVKSILGIIIVLRVVAQASSPSMASSRM